MATITIFADGHVSVTDAHAAWTNAANAYNGNITNFASTTKNGSFNTNALAIVGANTSTIPNEAIITQVRVRHYGKARASGSYLYCFVSTGGVSDTVYVFGATVQYSSWATLPIPSGGWTKALLDGISATSYSSSSVTTGTADLYRIEYEVTYADPSAMMLFF